MKFRRRSEPSTAPIVDPDSQVPAAASDSSAGAATPRTGGPFDESEIAGDDVQRVDLGSLLVAPSEGRELRMQVDEKTGTVQAVMIAAEDGALELQVFAAPRGGDLWSTVRPQIQADITRRGGKAEEREGRFGTELVCQVPVQVAEGQVGLQPSRIIGINGPRWLLRASFLGRPALEPDDAGSWEDVLAQVAVRRGAAAMPVGEPIPATLPDQARRVQ